MGAHLRRKCLFSNASGKYEPGIANSDVTSLVEDIRQSTIHYANTYLEQKLPRDDYKEFLELVIVFLGSAPARGVSFMSPGAMHHARWMSKVIYSLKIWMFRAQFKLTPAEERGLRDVCVFVVRVYLKAWFSSPQAVCAPSNDLHLLKSLLEYRSIHENISKATARKLSNHLWYLSPELVGLAFFDCDVSSATKRSMIEALKMDDDQDEQHDHSKKATVDLKSFPGKNIQDFVIPRSMKLFQMIFRMTFSMLIQMCGMIETITNMQEKHCSL